MYQKSTLDNGLRIITIPMPRIHSVSICMFVGIGSRYELEAEAGISHFIEHMLFKGTSKRKTAREISETIERVGGILNGGTNKEITLYWCKVTQPHFKLAVDLLADILLNSRFDQQDIEKERQVIIEEINMSKDSPPQRVDMLIDELLWPNHPLGQDIAGNKESISTISKEMMLSYHSGKYLPSNTVITIAGNIQHEQATNTVSQVLGNWSNRRELPEYLSYPAHKEPAVQRLNIETKETEQAHLCLGLPGLSIFHPKRFTLNLLNVILSGGMGSRLFSEIRDKLGLVYNIHSYVDEYLDTGSIIISAGVDPKNLLAVIKATLEQLSLCKETIPESELSKAKELSKGRLLLRMEDSRNVASWIGGQEILTNNILSIDQVVSIIDAISVNEIKELAEELLIEEKLHLAVVGRINKNETLENLLKL
ncbi:MAG: pitrilysin family protein [Dehalococcoidales bacterium]|nr:pitrilysin family protein [Dehalococcoidales bacterium]